MGLVLGGLGLVLSLVMWLSIGVDEPRAAPWKLGTLGFGGVTAVSAAGLLIGRRKR